MIADLRFSTLTGALPLPYEFETPAATRMPETPSPIEEPTHRRQECTSDAVCEPEIAAR
jgi:hypothetical protein